MSVDFPSRTLVLHDGAGVAFGTIRLAPREPDSSKWDCIFDIALDASSAQAQRSEVRWLAKRGYVRWGEHRVKVDAKTGTLTMTQGDFKLVLVPDEDGGFASNPPQPPVRAYWGGPQG